MQIGSDDLTRGEFFTKSTTAAREHEFEIVLIDTKETGLLSEEELPEQRGLKKYKDYHDRDVWYFPLDYLEKLKILLLQRKK
jgi:hypothetical protein